MSFSTLWRTVLAWTGGILLTLILIPPGLILLALDPIKQRLAQPFVIFWARAIMRMCFIKIRVLGLENIKGAKSAVFAANHQSMVDIFMMIAYIPRRTAFLAKHQTLFIPVIGQLIPMLGHITVDRNNPKRSLRSVQKCIRALSGNRSIVIFPEGTRTLTGEMNRFKSGSLKIPLRTGAPVVPVTICGTLNVMPKNTFGVRPHTVVMHLGKPVETKEMQVSDFRLFVDHLEQTIRETKARLEQEYPDTAPLPESVVT
jgi:1-acyl-sn-glycerol-3-phosphate acyltransferase